MPTGCIRLHLMRFVKHESHNSSTIKSQMKDMLHAGPIQWGQKTFEVK